MEAKLRTYENTQELFEFLIRVNKKDSAFTYFSFEANEGLCMYSTLEDSLKENYRDIHILGAIEYQEAFENLLSILSSQFPITVLKQTTKKDI